MTMTTIIKIRHELDKIISFLEPLLPFVNSHMVDYFSQSCFKNLPLEIKTEILHNNHLQLINDILNDHVTFNKTPHLYNYIKNTKSLYLSNLRTVCLSKDELDLKLKSWGCGDYKSIKLQVYIKQKKSHEVKILSEVVAALTIYKGTRHIIDIGDGKGYLSSMLALQHQIPVLGMDSSVTKTHGAIKRVERLKKIWKGIEINPSKSMVSNNTYEINNNLYKQATQFITEHTDFSSVINEAFHEDIEAFGLVGLHTCGNLGATSVKSFKTNKRAKILCNVSCCYHLLDEEFSKPFDGSFGFPLSDCLRKQQYKLGQTARMLASQAIDRIHSHKELPKNTIFYRALLEVLLVKYNCAVKYKRIGKFKKAFDNFSDYVHCALENIGLTVCDQEISELYNTYKDYENELIIFHLLRTMLAPIIESLILLDRLLFLHESGYSDSVLVQLFDPIVSPRCYGIIAFKDC